jgi:hypothetical protein
MNGWNQLGLEYADEKLYVAAFTPDNSVGFVDTVAVGGTPASGYHWEMVTRCPPDT